MPERAASADTCGDVLIITNDFPPGVGGIEVMVQAVCDALTAAGHRVTVLTSAPGATLLPTGRTAEIASWLARSTRARTVVFGAAAPLGLLARDLRPHVDRIIALSHGHECWWASAPGARRLLRRIGDDVDVWTTISSHTDGMIAPALSPVARRRMTRLSPPVDLDRFHPAPIPRTGPPVVLAAARLVAQKGIDVLLRAWSLLDHGTGAGRPILRIVGDGPQRRRLERMAPSGVEFWGERPHRLMPEIMRDADVFALPVRSRLGGWYAEGFGLVFAEAQASGVPVLAGDSGGVRDVVQNGRTGYVLDSTDVQQWAERLAELVEDADGRRAMGTFARRHAARFSHQGFARKVVEMVQHAGPTVADAASDKAG
ncbi:glycosyltransferase family 4 protein [Propioniferax innocua]|uniref:Phosphatidylinositol alpha-1,6-mannosyltransferase n=1 Tax=Propioniferax innocua TaxID=1753 RepID=A0A542ZR50_9ACTN|nr:glycosyltransferase family 4 protein [Propioniferax innocua]TQL62835.1 phosphatidylinositol alpha-1,6-mannosyltransferase [Propioniferax innocua]